MRILVVASIAALMLGTSVASANPRHHAQPATSAESTAPRGMMGMMGMTCPMMGGHVEGSLAFLKTELKISDDQASAWNSFADAYRTFAASKAAMKTRGMMSGGMMGGGSGDAATGDDAMSQRQSAMSFPEHMKAHMQMMQKHFDAGQKFAPAVEDLYAALSPEQRKTADELLPMFTMMGGMM